MAGHSNKKFFYIFYILIFKKYIDIFINIIKFRNIENILLSHNLYPNFKSIKKNQSDIYVLEYILIH